MGFYFGLNYLVTIHILLNYFHFHSVLSNPTPTLSPSPTIEAVLPTPSPETSGSKLSVDIILNIPLSSFNQPEVRIKFRQALMESLGVSILADVRIRKFYLQVVPSSGDLVVQTEIFFSTQSEALNAQIAIVEGDEMIKTISKYLQNDAIIITSYQCRNIEITNFSSNESRNSSDSDFFSSTLFWGFLIGGITILSICVSLFATIYKCMRKPSKKNPALFMITDDVEQPNLAKTVSRQDSRAPSSQDSKGLTRQDSKALNRQDSKGLVRQESKGINKQDSKAFNRQGSTKGLTRQDSKQSMNNSNNSNNNNNNNNNTVLQKKISKNMMNPLPEKNAQGGSGAILSESDHDQEEEEEEEGQEEGFKPKVILEDELKIKIEVVEQYGAEYEAKIRNLYESQLKAEREARIKAEFEIKVGTQHEMRLINEYESYLQREREAKERLYKDSVGFTSLSTQQEEPYPGMVWEDDGMMAPLSAQIKEDFRISYFRPDYSHSIHNQSEIHSQSEIPESCETTGDTPQ